MKNHVRCFFLSSFCCLSLFAALGQSAPLTPTPDQQLRGGTSALRTCYDVQAYALDLIVDVNRRYLRGSNRIVFLTVHDFDSLQLDLFANLRIDSIVLRNQRISYRRLHHSVIVRFPERQLAGRRDSLTVYYQGSPLVAKNPPWEGGMVWKKDAQARPWVGVACQGLGASVWFPCKDQLADEPQQVWLRFTAPASLTCVANGRLIARYPTDSLTTWQWHVSYPINIYNITFNLGHFERISDWMLSGSDTLTLDYYVLDYNALTAKAHLQQTRPMLTCFNERFGLYPFVRDGFKLVETPYWGMEHQSAISYGNDYINNKWGFDFILIHESAHEWWGNNLSAADYADLWLHEGFATYAETIFLECLTGDSIARAYLAQQAFSIRNRLPLVGPRGVMYRFSDNDIYYKGAWVIHTFRYALGNDSLFFALLRHLQQQFGLRTLLTEDFISAVNSFTATDWTPFFRQYLYHAQPPELQYRLRNRGRRTQVSLRWNASEPGFALPAAIADSYHHSLGVVRRTYRRVAVTTAWQQYEIPRIRADRFEVQRNGYFLIKQIK